MLVFESIPLVEYSWGDFPFRLLRVEPRVQVWVGLGWDLVTNRAYSRGYRWRNERSGVGIFGHVPDCCFRACLPLIDKVSYFRNSYSHFSWTVFGPIVRYMVLAILQLINEIWSNRTCPTKINISLRRLIVSPTLSVNRKVLVQFLCLWFIAPADTNQHFLTLDL